MRDPFYCESETCIAFSGGRTSALMLHRVLEAHGGSLPDHVLVSFQNTGKEHLATLDFVRDVQEHWGVPIVWLEYQPDPPGYRIVSHETASRAGEPYEALIVKRKYLPNPVARFCTAELKVRISHKYIRDVKGWEEWDQMVGIRADEQRRASRVRNRPNPEPKAETMIIPLADAGVTVEDVTAFWDSQPFNLGIPTVNGKALLGNCDACLTGETEVVTDRGIMPIESVYRATSKPKLLAPRIINGGISETGHFVDAPVNMFGEDDLWRIELAGKGGSKKVIRATGDHRWFVHQKRGGKSEVRTADLRPGHTLASVHCSRVGEDRSDFCWIAAMQGVVFGDGSRASGRRPGTIDLYGEKADAFKSHFNFMFGDGREAENDRGTPFLHYYGIPRTWKFQPSLTESRPFLFGWLAGLFAADGCVATDGTCTIHAANESVIQFVRSICAILGIQTWPVRSTSRRVTLPQGGQRNHTMFCMNINRHHLGERFFLLKKHRARYIDNQAKAVKQYRWTVRSVKRTGDTALVYCATVEGVGAFGLADGLMTGNCFLKGPKQLMSIIAHEPWRADWWAEMEEKASGLTSSPNGALFRSDRPSYREMQRRALAQDDLFGADEEMLGCFCGD